MVENPANTSRGNRPSTTFAQQAKALLRQAAQPRAQEQLKEQLERKKQLSKYHKKMGNIFDDALKVQRIPKLKRAFYAEEPWVAITSIHKADWPSIFDTMVGKKYSVLFFSSSELTHQRGANKVRQVYYDAVFTNQPPGYRDWLFWNQLSDSECRAKIDQMRSQQFTMLSLHVNPATEQQYQVQFARLLPQLPLGLEVEVPLYVPWQTTRDLGLIAHKRKYKQLVAAGWLPRCVSVVYRKAEKKPARLTTLYHQADHIGQFAAEWNIKLARFKQRCQHYTERGFAFVDLHVTSDLSGVPRFSAVWRKGQGVAKQRFNMLTTTYHEVRERLRQQGWRSDMAVSYMLDGVVRFTAQWLRS